MLRRRRSRVDLVLMFSLGYDEAVIVRYKLIYKDDSVYLHILQGLIGGFIE